MIVKKDGYFRSLYMLYSIFKSNLMKGGNTYGK